MDHFHTLDWPQRVPVIDRFADGRLRALGQRLLYVEAPDLMDDAARRDYDAAIAQRLMGVDRTMPWLTYPQALSEIEDMIATAVGDEVVLLAEHRGYLRNRAAWAGSFLD